MGSNIFEEAERQLCLNSVLTPMFLGVSKGNWSTWKHGKPAPDYVIKSIEAHLALSKREIRRLMKERGISAG